MAGKPREKITHTGEDRDKLRDLLGQLGLRQGDVAKRMDRSQTTVGGILKGNPLTRETVSSFYDAIDACIKSGYEQDKLSTEETRGWHEYVNDLRTKVGITTRNFQGQVSVSALEIMGRHIDWNAVLEEQIGTIRKVYDTSTAPQKAIILDGLERMVDAYCSPAGDN